LLLLLLLLSLAKAEAVIESSHHLTLTSSSLGSITDFGQGLATPSAGAVEPGCAVINQTLL